MKKKNYYSSKHYSMICLVVLFVFDAAQVLITNSVLAIKLAMESLRSRSQAIAALYDLKSTDLKGLASQKAAVRKALMQYALSIMKPVKAYGISVDDQNLIQNMSVTKSFLKSLTFQQLVSRMNSAIALVAPLVTDNKLGDYSITQQDIDTWKALNKSLNDMLEVPEGAYKNLEQINTDIQNMLRDTVTYLVDTCDSVVERVSGNHPAYVNQYFINRKLKNFSRHTILRAFAETEDHMALYNVRINILGTPSTGTTGLDGQCNLEKVHHGIHTVEAVYGTQTVRKENVQFKLGQSVTIRFTLAPTGFSVPEIVEEPAPANA